jgi:hypothetical protein
MVITLTPGSPYYCHFCGFYLIAALCRDTRRASTVGAYQLPNVLAEFVSLSCVRWACR